MGTMSSPDSAAEVPEGAYIRRDSLIGRVLVTPVFTGDVFLPGKLAPVGVAPGLEPLTHEAAAGRGGG